MRASTLIVAAVALIALFAAVDALRGSRTSKPAPTTTGEERAPLELKPVAGEPTIEGLDVLEPRLRAAGVAGTLFLTDEDCRLRALSLPDLKWVLESGAGEECEFSVASDSRRTVRSGEGVAWSPNGRTSASCERGSTHVNGRTEQELYEVVGYCAPAWKPNGTFTLARGGTLVTFRPPCKEGQRVCEHVLLSQHEIGRALRIASTPFRTLRAPYIRQAVWLSDRRVALLIHANVLAQPGTHSDVIAIFEDRHLIADPLTSLRLDDFAVSPSRDYLASRARLRGLIFIDADGRLLARNPLASGHHAAWSPDEQWTAVATGGSIYLFRTSELAFFNSDSRPPAIRIPVYAADLEWR